MPKNQTERIIDRPFIAALRGGATSSGSSGGGGGVSYAAGQGIDISANVISVDVTDIIDTAYGLTENGNQIRINLASSGGLEFSSGLRVDNTVVRTSRTLTAGNGLTGGGDLSADRSFAVGAGDGIDVAADSVSVDVTDIIDTSFGLTENNNNIRINLASNGGLEFSGGALKMGSPSSVSVTSTNSLSGANHAHAVTASSDTYTVREATLLKTGSNGELALNILAVGTVTSTLANGDFMVGDRILWVDHDRESIGVNREPDPQFDVDVNGALRALYLVGKHAIQLDEALLICHFDGRGPFNTNTVIDLHGHAGQVPVTSGTLIGREGKFQAALEISQAHTNILTNRQFDSGSTTGWSAYSTGSATGTRATTLEDAYAGEYSYKIVKTGGTGAWGTQTTFSATNGTTYAGSIWVKVLASDLSGANAGDFAIELEGPFASTVTETYEFREDPSDTQWPLNEWVRMSVKATANANGTATLRFRNAFATTYTALIDAAQVTTSQHYPYYDGSRSEGSLRYDNVPVNWRRMTWMAWIRVTDSGAAQQIGEIRVDDSNRYNLTVTASNQINFLVNGNSVVMSTSTIAPGRWAHVAVVVSGTTATLYVNGITGNGVDTQDTGTISTLPVGVPAVRVGGRNAAGQTFIGHIDDFVITAKAEPARSIRSIYESNAPVFAESSVFHFKSTPKQLVWADDNGLWVRNTANGAVFGVYGGETSAYSWGGMSLDPSDLLIGDKNRGAYVHWDDDEGDIYISNGTAGVVLDGSTGQLSLYDGAGHLGILLAASGGISIRDQAGTERFGISNTGVTTWKNSSGNAVITFDGSGGAEFSGVMTIGTSGEIRQGTGTLGSNFTGLRIWRASNVGRIAGYNNNTIQWTANTSGQLAAGSGDVVLDANGITLNSGNFNTARVKWGNATTPVAALSNYNNQFIVQSGTTAQQGNISIRSFFNSSLDFVELLVDGQSASPNVSITPDSGSPNSNFIVSTNGVANNAGQLSTIGALGIGVSLGSILGNLYSYTSTGRFTHFSAAAIGATPYVIIPDGAGDVQYTVRFHYQVRASGGGFNNATNLIDLAGTDQTLLLYDAGGQQLTARLKSNGQFELQRTAGTNTFTVNMLIWWM